MRCIGLKVAFAAGLVLASAASVLAADSAPVPNAPARVLNTDDGQVLVTPAGMTLYAFGGAGVAGVSNPGGGGGAQAGGGGQGGRGGGGGCSSTVVRERPDPTAGLGTFPIVGHQWLRSCIEKWPPYMASADAKPVGEFSLVDRPEGGKQWAYRGSPLHTSIKDHQPGDRSGVTSPIADPRGGGGQYGGSAGRLAGPAVVFPPGVRLAKYTVDLVLASGNSRPLYTPRGKVSKQDEELFRPLVAPAVGAVSEDWTGQWVLVSSGAGRRQYAYEGKPLYKAPETTSDADIMESGAWDVVVFQKGTAPPSQIQTRFTLLGDIYTNKDGMSLYTINCGGGCDDPGDGAANWAALCGSGDECARRWRPYLAQKDAKPQGEWSIVEVSNPMFIDPAGQIYPPETPRVKAWAWRGRPVYTYYEDKQPKDVFGNQVRWFGAGGAFAAVRVAGRGLLD